MDGLEKVVIPVNRSRETGSGCEYWITAFAGMTDKTHFRLFTAGSILNPAFTIVPGVNCPRAIPFRNVCCQKNLPA